MTFMLFMVNIFSEIYLKGMKFRGWSAEFLQPDTCNLKLYFFRSLMMVFWISRSTRD